MKKAVIVLVLLVIAAVGWFGYKWINNPTPDVVNSKPDFVITAADLIAAFDKDTAAAGKMYVDKLVEVTGNVRSIDTTGSVVLGDEGTASAVTVSLDRRHIKDQQKLKVGSVAVIQGKCTGYNKGDGEDLIESLGTTVELNFAGVKDKK
jgi:hypothetical protein